MYFEEKLWKVWTIKCFMFHVLCGPHLGNIFFSESERDSGEIAHEIGDECNFGLSQQSAKNLLKFQPQGR